MQRREFLRLLSLAAAAGAALRPGASSAQAASELYDVPPFGNVSLLHMTDSHAQLRPIYFREPSVNLGVGEAEGRPPHLVGEALLRHFRIRPGTAQAHAFSYLDFTQAARTYGKVGGFAHLATLVKRLRAERPHAWLLDGGDTWQGSATSLWTNAQDMVDACKRLGVDIMTSHWEHTFGARRVQEIVEKDLKGHIEFLAHNIKTTDFEDLVFKPYTLREMNGVPVAVIGRVTDDGDISVVEGGTEIVRIPASALTSNAIVHERLAAPPAHRRAAPAPGAPTVVSDRLPERGMDPGAVLLALVGSPNLATRRPVFEQYDAGTEPSGAGTTS